jgi:hypothetical protein
VLIVECILRCEPNDLIDGKTTYERAADEIERLRDKLANAVMERDSAIAKRDDARKAARLLQIHFEQSTRSPVYYLGVMAELYAKFPWLEEESDDV